MQYVHQMSQIKAESMHFSHIVIASLKIHYSGI